ncbi:UNVERIFIED_CONTAM: hypothetical protein FKN15_056645 [Acipenser sinensis]
MDNSGKEKEALALIAEAEKKTKSSQSFFASMFGPFMPEKLEPGTAAMDNSGKEKEALALIAEAEKKTKSSQSFFASMFGGSSKLEEACEMYIRAANMFKMGKNWSEAINCLNSAIEIYTDMVGTHAMDSTLLKYSAKEYFFKAALCHFCVDMLNAKVIPSLSVSLKSLEESWQLALQKYEEMFPAFSDSRECKLVKKLLDAHEEQNVDAYTESVKEYDTISRLDQWLTTMLLRIKKTIQGEESDLR